MDSNGIRQTQFDDFSELKQLVKANGDCLTVFAGDLIHAGGFRRTRPGPWAAVKKELRSQELEVYPEEPADWRADEEVRVYAAGSGPSRLKAAVLWPSRDGDKLLQEFAPAGDTTSGPDLASIRQLLKGALDELGEA